MTEAQLHQNVADYLNLQYRGVIFHTDFGSGIKLTIGQAGRQKRLNSSRAWPDVEIPEPRGGYSGMFLELKREGVRIILKTGQLTADPHIREQYAMLQNLRDRGFYAEFGVGFEDSRRLIDDYLAMPQTARPPKLSRG